MDKRYRSSRYGLIFHPAMLHYEKLKQVAKTCCWSILPG